MSAPKPAGVVLPDAAREVPEQRGLTVEDLIDHGAVWVRTRDELLAAAPEFSGEGNGAAVTPGWLFRMTGIGGEVTHQLRPQYPLDPDWKYLFAKCHHQPFALIRGARTATTELVLIVEGTIQSLAAARYAAPGVMVVAVPGCTGWYPGADLLRRVVAHIGAPVVAVFDADAATNPNVYDAGVKLAETLAGAAPSVRFARVPGDGTTGLDDYLAALPEADR